MRWQPLAAGLTCHSQSTEQPGIFLRHMAQMCQEWPQRVTKLCCNTDSILQCHQMTSTSSRNFQLFRIFAFQGTEAGLVSRRVRKKHLLNADDERLPGKNSIRWGEKPKSQDVPSMMADLDRFGTFHIISETNMSNQMLSIKARTFFSCVGWVTAFGRAQTELLSNSGLRKGCS